MIDENILLSIRDLSVEFATDEGAVRAIGGVGFDVAKGRTLAVVGESGCGKSVTALSVMGLIPDPPGRVVGGGVGPRADQRHGALQHVEQLRQLVQRRAAKEAAQGRHAGIVSRGLFHLSAVFADPHAAKFPHRDLAAV